jgi:hypothetical protein
MQKLGETMAAGCGFTIDELREAEGAFAAVGAQVRAARRSSLILIQHAPALHLTPSSAN